MKDLGLFILVPFILGFVGERFKNMQTWLYAIFIFLIILGTEIYYFFTLNSKIFGDWFCNSLYGLALIISVALFHIQKRKTSTH